MQLSSLMWKSLFALEIQSRPQLRFDFSSGPLLHIIPSLPRLSPNRHHLNKASMVQKEQEKKKAMLCHNVGFREAAGVI